MRSSRLAALAAVAALVLSGCGTDDEGGNGYGGGETPEFEAGTTMAELADAGSIRVGTKFDQPLCSVQGSTPSENIREYLANEDEQLVLFGGYAECVAALDAGDVDAVTTDNVILLGFIAESPDAYKLVDSGTFTEEPYGIGVQLGDDAFRDWINDVLEASFTDGRYEQAWNATAGATGEPVTPPTVDRY